MRSGVPSIAYRESNASSYLSRQGDKPKYRSGSWYERSAKAAVNECDDQDEKARELSLREQADRINSQSGLSSKFCKEKLLS